MYRFTRFFCCAALSLVSLMAHAQPSRGTPADAAGSAATPPTVPTKDAGTSGVGAPIAVTNPLEADYKIGSQDLIEIVVLGQPDLTRTVRVNSRGMISMPLIGQLDVVGKSAQQLEALIADRLREDFLQNPQVTIFIKEFTSLRFTVEGAVNKPGVYPIVGPMTLLRALAVAGGQGQLSDMSEIMLFRIKPDATRVTLVFDAEKIRAGEQPDPPILNDDLVVVKRNKARAAVKDSLFRDILDFINPIPFLR